MTRKEAAINQIVEKVLKKEAEKDICDQEQLAFTTLKTAAKQFLNSIQQQSEMITHQSLVQQMEGTKALRDMVYANMKNSTIYTRNILEAQHQFEMVLNNFLNRKIYLTYIEDDGTLIAHSDAAVNELYKNYATANDGRGNLTAENIQKVLNLNENMSVINEELKKRAASKRGVYMTAIERWKGKPTDMHYKREKTFFWRIAHNKIGYTSPIQKQGIIAEGYAEAVIANDNTISDASDNLKELSLKILYDNYIKKDSIPAAVKGDVVEKNGYIQYAIKQGQFSTAKIGQYINLAYNISLLRDDTLRRDFALALPKLVSFSQISQKIVQTINDNAENVVTEIVKASLQNVTINSKSWIEKVELMTINL